MKEMEKQPENQLSEVKVREGKIWCKFKGTVVDIASPDDLFKIGINEPDLKALGLPPPMI